MHLEILYDLIGQYGVYAIFILVMIEGDITLLLAGVLAQGYFFGDYGFARVLLWGTFGGFVSDNAAYLTGRGFNKGVRNLRFYKLAQPRIERLTSKFGGLSIFLSKYIYGLRWAACIFYGVTRMPYLRFMALSLASCFLWVFVLISAGYFFSGAVMGLIGDFERLGRVLLVIVVLGVIAFYLIERLWLSQKVEQVNPERLQGLEQAAQEKLHDLKQEFQEHLPFTPPRRKKRRLAAKRRKADAKTDQ